MHRMLRSLYCKLIPIFPLIVCSPMAPMSPFERIEDSRIRPVGMVISPNPECAPGDTLHVHAFFEGKPTVKATDFRLCIGAFDTIGKPISVSALHEALPDSLTFSYQIPDTLLDSLLWQLRSLPEYFPLLDTLVAAFQLNTLDNLPVLDSAQSKAALYMLEHLNLLCRFMVTIQCADGEALTVRKNFMVRYNCRFQTIPPLAARLPVNHNPALRFVALYTVEGNHSSFHPSDTPAAYTIRYLQTSIPGTIKNDTIDIDTGHSYFLGTDTGIVTYTDDNGTQIADTCIDQYLMERPVSIDDPTKKDSLISEQFSYVWMYESKGVSSSSSDTQMALQQNEHGAIIKLFPPLDLNVLGCTIWVKITDYLWQSAMPRPVGLSRTSVPCVFRYSDAYKKSIAQ